MLAALQSSACSNCILTDCNFVFHTLRNRNSATNVQVCIVAFGLPLVDWLQNYLFAKANAELKKEKRLQTTNTSSSQHSWERTQDTPLSLILTNICLLSSCKSQCETKHFETLSLDLLGRCYFVIIIYLVGGPFYLTAEWQREKDPDL